MSSHLDAPPVFLDHEVFASSVVTVGEFRCTVDHPAFEDSGPIRQDCFVFPRLAVSIEHEHERAFVANPNVVAFYNAGQRYRRAAISPDGDHCHWFAIDRDTTREVLEQAGIALAADGPYDWTRAMADSDAYLTHRDVVDAVRTVGQSPAIDAAGIEERVILLLDRLVRAAVDRPADARAFRYRPATHDAVHEIEVLLSARWNESWQLSELARRAGLSPFHLCRAFHRLTGCTLHQYRLRLRLRAALDEMRRTRRSLVDIALDAGFCSHSHFTSAFRREFGALPSELRLGFAMCAPAISITS